MSLAQAFLAEFEQESKITRRFLEQLPAGRLSWKPHEKSLSAGQLALHIAGVPAGVLGMAMSDEAALPDFSKPFPEPTSVDEVLSTHDKGAAEVRRLLPTLTDERLAQTWHGVAGGERKFSMPRTAVLRTIMLNHWIQHRGQFGVFLRLMGAKVPSSYGPSGDEPMGG